MAGEKTAGVTEIFLLVSLEPQRRLNTAFSGENK